ncbi:MAG: ABC transporter substrate-binding protein [Actinomycetia bacterium]|nr:ABC transporter substrate-binding protein [Actinomycetes bacterium]
MKLHKRGWYLIVLALALVGVLVVFSACGGDEETTETTLAGGAEPVEGGTFNIYVSEPAFIDPVNLQESEGTQVGNQLFDSLAMFDYKTSALMPAAAESWEANADATVWTFHLVEDAKFHDGSDVTADDFKYAWERICNPVNESEISYHLSCVKGYDEMQDGSATELAGVKVVDEYTLEVTLNYAFGDFEYVVAHPALAPVPKEVVEADPAAFGDKPVGNGPYMMAEPWAHDQYIKVVRFDDYYGEKARADGVNFLIFKDDDTAFLEFQAGNLDFTSIPSGQVEATKAKYGVSDDGMEAAPGKQTLTGPETAVYYILINNKNEVLSNAAVRQALSLAINRQAIIDTIFEGLREPATGIVPWGVDGYIKDQWPYAKYDMEAAKAKLAEAGYPNGEGLSTITLSCNSGVGHEDIMAMIQADFAKIGVTAEIDAIEWAQYLDKLGAGDFMLGRLGWIADYPIMDNFLYPLFATGSGDNYSFYSDPAVDQALLDARATVDRAERIAKYQAIERTIGEAAPVIPLVMYRMGRVCSDRVLGLVLSPQGLLNLEQAWIAQAE